MKVSSSGYTGLGFSGQYVRRMSDKELEAYRESLGPCPRYPRSETVQLAIAAATLALQCTDETDAYEQCVRNVRQLRGIHDMLIAKSGAAA
jgi:hypothetical protein